jgi:phage FluMu gp28-like protein
MYHKAIKSDSYVTVDLMLADLHRQYPFSRLVFDRTGIGGPLEEHLRELGLPIEPVVITADRAQEMMFNMKALMENRKLALPNSFDLLNHLNAVTAEKSWSGRHLFRKRTGTYDDLAYALALALKEEKRGVIFVIQP